MFETNIGNLLVSAVMSIWMLYSSHNRQIYLFKLHRIHELERTLGMCQNLRFGKHSDKRYSVRFKGYVLDIFIYAIISFGSLLLGGVINCNERWDCKNLILFCLVPILIIGVIFLVIHTEMKVKKEIRKLEKGSNQKPIL